MKTLQERIDAIDPRRRACIEGRKELYNLAYPYLFQTCYEAQLVYHKAGDNVYVICVNEDAYTIRYPSYPTTMIFTLDEVLDELVKFIVN